MLSKAVDRSQVFELETRDNEKINDLISKFRNGEKIYQTKIYNPVSGEIDVDQIYDLTKNILIIEGIFMFHPKLPLNKLWDKRIYFEGNEVQIDARRVKREKEKWGKDYFPETHPDSYFQYKHHNSRAPLSRPPCAG